MTTQTTPTPDRPEVGPDHGYIGYEYARVRAPRGLESLYTDTYKSFGWILDETVDNGIGPAELVLKRDRRIRNRPMVQELQRTAVASLRDIAKMESSKSSVPMAVALGIGVAGCVPLAGSVFMIVGATGGVLATGLGVIGLALWAAAPLAHRKVTAARVERLDEQIDGQQDAIFDAGEQASKLLR